MISSILYERKLKEKENNYFFSEKYIEFLITRFIFIKQEVKIKEVYNYIINYVNSNLVKTSALKRFLKENYENKKTLYYLNQKQKENIINTLNMKKNLDFSMFVSESKLCLKISEQITDNSFDFDKTLLNVLMLDFKYNKSNNKDYYLGLIYNIKNNYYNLVSKIKNSITSIDSFYNELELSTVISNENIIKILSLNNTITIEDLINCSSEKLLSIFSIDLDELFGLVSTIGDSYKRVFNNTVYFDLSERELLVFKKRFNYYSNEPQLTLEQIGTKLGVTRERIRQIESKVINKLLLQIPIIKNILKCVYIKLLNKDEQFINVDRLYTYLEELNKKNYEKKEKEKKKIYFLI